MARRQKEPTDRERLAAYEARTGLRQYGSSVHDVGFAAVDALWGAAVRLLAPELTLAEVDLLPDESWAAAWSALPDRARAALLVLRAAAPDPGRKISQHLPVTEEIAEALAAYGAYSISVFLWRSEEAPPALINHDSGMVLLMLGDAQVAALRGHLDGAGLPQRTLVREVP